MEIDFDEKGLDEDIAQLIRLMQRTLPGLVAERVQGDALFAAAKITAAEAKKTTAFEDKTGALRKSIRARRIPVEVETPSGFKKVPGGAAQAIAGGKGARQAYLIEKGREAGQYLGRGKTKRTGNFPKAPPHPYLEPAFLATRNQALAAFGVAAKKAFIRTVRQFARGKPTKLARRLAAE